MNEKNFGFEKQDTEYLITRHSLKPEKGVAASERYPGITEEGVELAKERAKDLLTNIEQSDAGTIVWFGGVTNEIRTRSTMQVYVDAIKEMIARGDIPDITVLERTEITKEGKLGPTNSIKKLTETIKEAPENKIVVGIPFLIKELTSRRWFDEQGKPTEYTLDLLKRSGKDEAKFVELWLQDSLESKAMPTAKEQAGEFSRGLSRMEEFMRRFIHDRDIKIVAVGHTSELNAYLTNFLPGNDLQESYNIAGGKPLEETEMAIISKAEDKIKIFFRGREYEKTSS